MGRWGVCWGTPASCTSQVCLVPPGEPGSGGASGGVARAHATTSLGPAEHNIKREQPWKKRESFDLLVNEGLLVLH